jgi:hypothetical protein
MLFVLANDPQLAGPWAEINGIAEDAWRASAAEELRAFPAGGHDEHSLVILEGAERAPEYSMIFDLARDRGIRATTVHYDPRTWIIIQ